MREVSCQFEAIAKKVMTEDYKFILLFVTLPVSASAIHRVDIILTCLTMAVVADLEISGLAGPYQDVDAIPKANLSTDSSLSMI